MDPEVFRCKVLNTLQYFARSIFLKLDIYTSRFLGAKYWILCTCNKYFFLKLDRWISSISDAKYWILCTSKKYFFEVGYMYPQVFRCKVLNTLHVQEVFFRSWIYGSPGIQVQSIEYFARARSIFSKLDIWTPRYSGAKYWILCTCNKYFFEVGYMNTQVFRCKVLSTLHVQEVFFRGWIYGPPGI